VPVSAGGPNVTCSGTDTYAAAGNVTVRVVGVFTQTNIWDSFGRLLATRQRDGSGNGFDFWSVYDAFGRRLRTSQTNFAAYAATTNVATIDSYFDPLVEFGEIGAGFNGARTWKLMGPDLSGTYGRLQGVGGLEATIRESDGWVEPVLNDYFGNVPATIQNGTATWSATRLRGYGPVPGYQAPGFSASVPLAEATLWRGRRIDPTGFYWVGARYYEPVSGRFLGTDPLGHAASMSLFDYAGGDPVNNVDADGRISSAAASFLTEGLANLSGGGPSIVDEVHAQQEVERAVVGIFNFATLGLPNAFSVSSTGFDLHGDRSDDATALGQVALSLLTAGTMLPGLPGAAGMELGLEAEITIKGEQEALAGLGTQSPGLAGGSVEQLEYGLIKELAPSTQVAETATESAVGESGLESTLLGLDLGLAPRNDIAAAF
jgi:RHS repeat-associated protein